MNGEEKDFIIEKLERQLKEKETEIEEIKKSLRDSILVELRSDFKNDLDFNNRLSKLENRVQELSNNLNGVIAELLDQKSLIRSLQKSPLEKKETDISTATDSLESIDLREGSAGNVTETRIRKDENKKTVSKTDSIRFPQSHAKLSSFSIKPTDLPRTTIGQTASATQRFNIRDVQPETTIVKKPEIEKRRTEYIIAESDDLRSYRKKERSSSTNSIGEFIVAKDNVSRKKSEKEYESVKTLDEEDAVVTVTRRK
ncbi:MAG: hypothetical protein H5T43_07910 [Methanomethylovorans sp.]|jgi:hypothetical protein|nr:hypothetical protein [Methanomethylovorans sp.]